MKTDKEREPRDIKERTFFFALNIVHLAQRLDEHSGVSRILGHQLLRSGTSIGANLEEAQAGKAARISPVSMQLPSRRRGRPVMTSGFAGRHDSTPTLLSTNGGGL